MSFFGPGGALLAKPALALSQLVIDADKVWSTMVAAAHAPAWALAGWYYRKKVTIAGTAAGAQVLYQVKIIINDYAGVDAGNTVYTSGLCKSDFSDLRFTNSAGALLDYWIESYTAKTTATVWVELDSVPIAPGTAEFYLYFGNSAAASLSNGAATFIIFNSGSSIVGWTDITGVGAGNIDWAVNAGKIRGTSTAVTATAFFYCNTITGVNSYRMHAHLLAQDGLTASDYRQGLVHKLAQDNVNSGYAAWRDSVDVWTILDEAGAWDDSPADATFDARVDHEYILIRTPAQSQLLVDNVLKVTHIRAAWSPQTIGLYARMAASAHYVDFWNIFVANYADPEPTFSAWAAQEDYYAPALGITTVKQLAAAMAKGDLLFSDGVRLVKLTSDSIGKCLTTHDFGFDPSWTYPP